MESHNLFYAINPNKSNDNEWKLAAWKLKEIEKHAELIKSVKITQPQYGIWGRYWVITFKEESIGIQEKRMRTSEAYEKAYWSMFLESAPSMKGQTWQFFENILKSKIVKEGL